MIVRIINEGQYRIEGEEIAGELNDLDNVAFDALERDDEEGLRDALRQMAELVRSRGTRLPDEDLSASDLQVPPEDLSLEEAKRAISDDGFIPDLPA